MRWFKHMTSSNRDEKLCQIRDQYGIAGYGAYWIILETIAEQMTDSDRTFIKLSIRNWQKLIEFSPKKLKNFMEFCQNQKIFSIKIDGNSITVDCPKLLKYRDEYANRTRKKIGTKSGQTPVQELDTETEAEEETEVVLVQEQLTATANSQFFSISRPDLKCSEKDWIRSQFIEFLRTNGKPYDSGASLETLLSFNHNLVGLYRRWLKIPLEVRMGVYVYIILDKTALDNQLSYGLRVAENMGPGSDAKSQLVVYVKNAKQLIESGITEVELNV